MVVDAIESVNVTAKRLISQPCHRIFAQSHLWLIWAIVSGLAIRLHRLDARSIWFDETASWRTSQFSSREMIQTIAADCHPPLYYFCLKLWTGIFGDSLWALRGLSVAFAVVLIVGVYLLVRAMYDESRALRLQRANWAAALAALLVAFSPIQIRMAVEARMYILGAALAVLSSWLLLVAWRRGNSLRLWFAYGASALLFAYTHYYALFTVFAQFLFLATALVAQHQGRFRAFIAQPRARGAAISSLVVTLGWLPWLPTFLAQRKQIQIEWWTAPFQASQLLRVGRSMLLGTGELDWIAIAGCCALFVIVLGLLLSRTLPTALLALAIVCPILLSTFYSLMYRNIIMDRFFVFTHVFVVCGAAVLVARISHTVIRNSVAISIALWSVFACYEMWSALDIDNRPGARGAAEFILRTGERRECVIVSSPLIYYPMLYHLRKDRECWMVRSDELRHFEGGAFALPSDFIKQEVLGEMRTGVAWVVTGGWGDRPLDIPAHWTLICSDTFREVYGFQGSLTVYQYRIQPTQ